MIPDAPDQDTKLGIAHDVRDRELWPLNGLRQNPLIAGLREERLKGLEPSTFCMLRRPSSVRAGNPLTARGLFLWFFRMRLVPEWYPTDVVDFSSVPGRA